jgi:hypothetical protein
VSPLQFLERFLRLSEYQEHTQVVSITKDVIIMARGKAVFLDYKPSLIAAAAFFVAIWKVNNLDNITC